MAIPRSRLLVAATGKKVQTAASRDAAHGLEPRPRVNLRLREHRRLRPEPLDNPAHERPDARRGHQHRRLALAAGMLEPLAHEGNKLGAFGRLHGEVALLALARSEEHTSELQSRFGISYAV